MAAVPGVRRAGQQILDLVHLVVADAELAGRQEDAAVVGLERVQVQRHQDDVRVVRRGLAVEQDVLVLGAVEAQVLVQVEGRVLAPDPVHQRDDVDDVARPIPVPDLVLVHLGVEVVLAARVARRVLAQLVAVVHAVGRADRRRQHQPHDEGRPAPLHQHVREDVRRVDEQVAPEVLGDRRLGDLGQVLLDLACARCAR